MNERDELRLRQLISEAAGVYWSMNQRQGYTAEDYDKAEQRILDHVHGIILGMACVKPTQSV